MEEPLKKAFDATIDLIKQLIALCTGSLALTATFIKDILKVPNGNAIPNLWLLFTTWALLLLSIFCGLFAHGAVIGTLEGADIDPSKRISPYNSNITIWTISQCVIFYLGILFLIVYVSMTL
jgi:hypothetical protein